MSRIGRGVSTLLPAVALAALALPLSSCSVDISAVFGDLSTNECSETSDCREGECRLGVCVAEQGELDTILLEITPPSTAPKVGGMQFLQVGQGFSENRDHYKVNLHVPASVKGFVAPYDVSGLTSNPDLADKLKACWTQDGTLPVKVTLVPREQILGLSTTSHVATAVRKTLDTLSASDPCGEKITSLGFKSVYEFALDVPAGDYDVYVEATDETPSDVPDFESVCRPNFIPHLVRAITVEAGDVCLPVLAAKPQVLNLDILWPSGTTEMLDGWGVDMVHPVTGNVLSPSHILTPEERTVTDIGEKYHITLPYLPVTGGDYADPGQELVRLTPPKDEPYPVIQLERSVLDALTAPGEAVIGNLKPFPPPVRFQAWVSKRANLDAAVPATVTLTATKLRGIDPGIFASFSRTVEVGDTGLLDATLLPGDYRARVVPHVGSGLAATEVTVTVPCGATDPLDPTKCDVTPTAAPQRVAGHVLLVPDAVDVTGRAVSPLGSALLDGAVVQGLAAQFRAKRCDMPETDAMVGDAGTCSSAPLGVLELALGEDQFVPRTVTASIGSRGRFTLADADCGQCEPRAGASFDIFVQPRDGSGLAWLVQTGVNVDSDRDLGSLELPLPIVQRGIVQVPRSGDTPAPVGGALIRAYIFRNDQGAYVSDETLPSCASRKVDAVNSGERCIRSVLQVAETRTGDDGKFQLLIPAALH